MNTRTNKYIALHLVPCSISGFSYWFRFAGSTKTKLTFWYLTSEELWKQSKENKGQKKSNTGETLLQWLYCCKAVLVNVEKTGLTY